MTNNNWEDALMLTVTRRRNRRAKTLPIRNNSVFEIRVLEDGFGKYRTSWYYARHLNGGVIFTGPRIDGLALHMKNIGR